MKKSTIIWAAVAVAVLALIIVNSEKTDGAKTPLICHVGGTMTPVMKVLGDLYHEETGQPVVINSAGSGELLAYIEGQKKGDLYVCHDPFIDILMQKWKLGIDGWLLAELTPVIVIQKGNPKKIHDIKDLTRADVRLILTDYELSSLGRMMNTIFTKAGIDFKELNKKKKIVTNKSGGYTANYVKMNNADAGLVWKAVWKLRDDALDFVPITPYLPVPYIDAVTSATGKDYYLTPMRVTIATLTCSKQLDEAEKFAEFIASPRVGQILDEYGFTMSGNKKLYEDGVKLTNESGEVIPAPDATGKIKILAAAGMRKALDEVIESFKADTGITVGPDYGGSGVILARAVTTDNTDLFMPADQWYIDRLKEKIATRVIDEKPVARFVPVLITAKGNPKNVKGLNDLLRSDLKVGLGAAKTCQIGRLTAQVLKKNGIDISKIDAKESTTVNELGVWVKMKNVDLAVVWEAIANNISNHVDVIQIPEEQTINSQVTISLLDTGKNQSGAKQFIEYLAGDKGRDILEKNGYNTAVK